MDLIPSALPKCRTPRDVVLFVLAEQTQRRNRHAISQRDLVRRINSSVQQLGSDSRFVTVEATAEVIAELVEERTILNLNEGRENVAPLLQLNDSVLSSPLFLSPQNRAQKKALRKARKKSKVKKMGPLKVKLKKAQRQIRRIQMIERTLAMKRQQKRLRKQKRERG